MIGRDEEWRGKYEYSVQELTRFMKFRQPRQISFGQLISKIGMTLCSSIAAHQLITLVEPRSRNMEMTTTQQKISLYFKRIRRPVEHTFTVFSIKIIIDEVQGYSNSKWSQYSKGSFTGFLSYFLSRPFDQIDTARQFILQNQKKNLSRFQGLKVVLRHEGWLGLYKNENMLGPICSTLYRSVYFGMWDRLNHKNTANNPFFQFLLIPFGASLSASIATLLPDKFRSFCYQISHERSRSIEKKYRQQKVDLKQPSQLLLQYISSNDFKFTKSDFTYIGVSVLKNWLILSFFACGQHLLQRKLEGEKQKI